MKIKQRFQAACLSLCFSLGAHAEFQSLDRIIAIVDDDVITQSDLDDKIAMVRSNLQQQANDYGMPSEEEIQKEVLNRLVLESLQMQLAKQGGISIGDEQLTQTMADIAKRNGLSLAEFPAKLAEEGIDYLAMREEVRKEMITQQVQQGHLQNRIQITEQEVNNFLASSEGQKITAQQYHAQHVLLSVDDSASSAQEQQAKEKLAAIRQQVLQGQVSFDALIQGETIDGVAIAGQDFAWQTLDDLPSLFSERIAAMEKNDISEPIRSGAGWHLLRLKNKSGGNILVDQVRGRHILISPSEVRSDEKALALATELYEKILQGDDFELLAKEYSEDKGSALQGGDLGWTGPGQFVPAFEETLHNLAVNDVSRPIKTQFGWHVIQKTGERTHDATEEDWKAQAQQAIFERKFSDELEAWLVRIKEEAFIEIK